MKLYHFIYRSVSWYQDSTAFEAMPLSEPGLEGILQFLVEMSVDSIVDSSDKNLSVLNMVLNVGFRYDKYFN